MLIAKISTVDSSVGSRAGAQNSSSLMSFGLIVSPGPHGRGPGGIVTLRGFGGDESKKRPFKTIMVFWNSSPYDPTAFTSQPTVREVQELQTASLRRRLGIRLRR